MDFPLWLTLAGLAGFIFACWFVLIEINKTLVKILVVLERNPSFTKGKDHV